MSDLRQLYQEMIIDHGRHPRHFGQLPEANCHQEGFNPLCGDKLMLHVLKKNNVLEKLSFEGCGCAISMASASLMIEALYGKTVDEADKMFNAFHQLVMGEHSDAIATQLGKLTVLAGVAEFPARVKCATLAWHTLKAALANQSSPVSTEDEI